jgi:hypothetical protein
MNEPEPDTRTFEVLLHNRSRVETALLALAKRAARKGLPVLTWTWGRPVTKTEHLSHDGAEYLPGALLHSSGEYGVTYAVPITRIPLSLPCGSVCYAGWTFVAALQHLDGENIVRAVPGQTVPEMYRHRGPTCDHCKAVRRRHDTYVLRHEDERVLQVGSTCIQDFLGSDEAGKLASQASLLAEARGLAEGACEGSGGSASADRTLAEYLPYVAWCVRVEGWTSRTVARETGKNATADYAWTYLTDAKAREKAGAKPTDVDDALAAEAEAWAEALTDDEVDTEKGSDYLHNLRAVARTGLVTFRTAGIAASAVTAYQRAIGRARERAERAARPVLDAHVGTVGKRETFAVVLDFVTGYDTEYGYTTVLKFRTPEGACLVWKASSTELGRGDVGKAFALTGTVKKHDDYKGAKQTMLSRCKVAEPGTEAPPKAKRAKRPTKAKGPDPETTDGMFGTEIEEVST